jgi:hypothetical protein
MGDQPPVKLKDLTPDERALVQALIDLKRLRRPPEQRSADGFHLHTTEHRRKEMTEAPQKVMVAVEGSDQNVVTYEVVGPVAVGDKLSFEYGNYPYAKRLTGVVVALGALPWTYPNGYVRPAYFGPCKRATVIESAESK